MLPKSSLCIDGDTEGINIGLIREALQVVYNNLGLSSNNVVSLKFCNDSEIREINKRYRGADQATDVISFPADSETGMYHANNTGEIFLGEILIDINYIAAHTNTSSFNNEVIRVFVHGVLHLLGYDHLNTNQMKEMQTIEEKILSLIVKDVELNG